MSVITISRQFGSGGDEIAEYICNNTGFQLFDKSVLARAAFEAGLSDQEIIDFSEDRYEIQGFFDRLFGRSRTVKQVRTLMEYKEGVQVVEKMKLGEEQALAFVKKAVLTAYNMGNQVIVGRGGQVILRSHPDVLHVRIEAALEDRLERVRSYPDFEEDSTSDSAEIQRLAQDKIDKSDAASADYLKRFYNVDWSDPMLYHLILNTSKMTIEQAAGLIMETARQLAIVPEPV